MRKKIVNLVFVLLVIAAVLGYAFEGRVRHFMQCFQTFSLTELELETIAGREAKIPDGMGGYIVFYSDLPGCSACVRKLVEFKDLLQVYDHIGFFAVVKDRKARQGFAEMMTEHEVPGEYLVDGRQVLANRFQLAEHPMLLFFNRDKRLIAGLPMDVDYDKLLRQYHRLIAEM